MNIKYRRLEPPKFSFECGYKVEVSPEPGIRCFPASRKVRSPRYDSTAERTQHNSTSRMTTGMLLTDLIKLNIITHGSTCRKKADLKSTEQIFVLVLFQH